MELTPEEKNTLSFFRMEFWIFTIALIINTLRPSLAFVTGLGWVGAAVVAFIYLIQHKKRILMPFFMWIPWLCWCAVCLANDFWWKGIHATVQYSCAPVCGLAVSTFTITPNVMERLRKYLIYVSVVTYLNFFPRIFVRQGAAVAMTVLVVSVIWLSCYIVNKEKKALFFYFTGVFLTAMAVTRMCLFALFCCSFLILAKNKRLAVLLFPLIILAGYFAFNSRAFQQKMFLAGHGTVYEMLFIKEKIRQDGREYLEKILRPPLKKKYWTGVGPRREISYIPEKVEIREVHNDYLALQFGYGMIGVLFFLFALLVQTLLCIRNTKPAKQFTEGRIISICMFPLLAAFLLLMKSDNICKYSFFFGNFYWILIGLLYAMAGKNESVPHEKSLISR